MTGERFLQKNLDLTFHRVVLGIAIVPVQAIHAIAPLE